MSQAQPVQPGAQGSVAIVGNHYQVGKKIGEGSFGVVFEGTNLLNGHIVAIKFEPRKSDAPQLRDEYRSYRILQGCPGIPQAYYYGTEGLHNVLCIDLLGPNLEDLFDLCGRKFTVKTVGMLAKQMIERVQCIHEKNLIYRDIKPDNFLIGLPGTDKADMIYMVDFGMAKLWRDPRTRQHIPYRERKSLSGTARYMSINTHLGREQSRRDDLEGLGHVFMYFLRGSLPWQGLKAANNKQKYERIGEKKQNVPIADLCEGYPEEFAIYLNYVRKLGFDETPDYEFLKELFGKVLRAAGEVDDSIFDWKQLNNSKGWQASSKLPSNLLQPLQHGTVHRPRDGATPTSRPHRTSAIPALNGQNSGMTPPSPAAIGRHVSKQRKHNSVGPLAGNVPGASGSTGLLLGSARASRAISPLQTQTQPSGAAGNPLLLASSTGAQPSSGGPSPQHPYAAATGMQPYGGRPSGVEREQSFSTPVQVLNAFGGPPGIRNSDGMGSKQPSMNNFAPSAHGPRPGANGYGSTAQMNGNVPNGAQERDLPAPPKRNAFLDFIRCRCG